jgi:hypothetical protein
MREFGFRDQSSTWLLDRILRVGATPKLVPLKVTPGDDHHHYLRLVTLYMTLNTGSAFRFVTNTVLNQAAILHHGKAC